MTPEEAEAGAGLPGERPFPWAERVLSAAADDDLPTLALADYACDQMGGVVERIKPDPAPGTSDQLLALQTLGVVAARSLRATMALVRFGYASEAAVFHRRLSEAHQRVLRILDPVNGRQRARDWLNGKDSTARKVSGLDDDLWAVISHNAHADHRAVTSHHVEGRDEPIRAFLPLRDVAKVNQQIVLDAMLVSQIALDIANACGMTISGTEEFAAALHDAMATYSGEARERP
jgi:hypothetical protein